MANVRFHATIPWQLGKFFELLSFNLQCVGIGLWIILFVVELCQMPNKITNHQTRTQDPCLDNLLITKTIHLFFNFQGVPFGPEILEESNLNKTISILK